VKEVPGIWDISPTTSASYLTPLTSIKASLFSPVFKDKEPDKPSETRIGIFFWG
jgi:hypothetical protein